MRTRWPVAIAFLIAVVLLSPRSGLGQDSPGRERDCPEELAGGAWSRLSIPEDFEAWTK